MDRQMDKAPYRVACQQLKKWGRRIDKKKVDEKIEEQGERRKDVNILCFKNILVVEGKKMNIKKDEVENILFLKTEEKKIPFML